VTYAITGVAVSLVVAVVDSSFLEQDEKDIVKIINRSREKYISYFFSLDNVEEVVIHSYKLKFFNPNFIKTISN